MLGPVSAWMGDHLWLGKPPWRRPRHPGLLSLSPPSVIGWNEYPAKAGGVNRQLCDTPAHIRGLTVWCWCQAVRTG